MNDDVAVKVDHVYKNFRLPHEKVSSIKNIFAHVLGYIRKRRKYETQHALSDISFEVKKGEFFGVVGRNGSGKSTLLKIIAGIYQPTKGNVAVHGKLVPFIELGVGFNPELTGRENIYLNGALLGFDSNEIDEMYDSIVDFAELEQFMDQKLKNYSSGMQVRLAFSMAVRAQADILLIDEVLAVGDADFQRKCFDYFKKLKKANITVVFVSHNMDAVLEYCDRAMLIENSKVLEIGKTSIISEKYLQLFAQDNPAPQNTEKVTDRWGDGTVIITNVQVRVDNNITITESIEAKENTEGPIAGFRIRDSAGEYVTGTNTKIEQKAIGNMLKGDKAIIEWRFPNILSDGEYVVDPSVLRDDGITPCDWWDEAAKFSVKKNRHLPYIVDPGFSTKIK